MSSNLDYLTEKAHNFRKETQKFTIKIYIAILSLGWFGTLVSILRSSVLSPSVITRNIIVISSAIGIAIILLIFAYNYDKNLDTVDWILMAITLSLYFILVSLSENNKIVNPSIWLPMFLMFVLSTFKFRYTVILLLVHASLTIYMMINYPVYTMTVSVDIYGYVLTIIVILSLVSKNFLKQINTYQDQIFTDYEEIQEKNLELTALNEEYYATQEELMSQHDEMHKLAYHDSLTDLYNRSGMKTVHQSLKHEKSSDFYMILADIDRFRELNNVYGYELGDLILKETSEIFRSSIHNVEAVGRIASDVFLLIVKVDSTTSPIIDTMNLMKSISYGSNRILIEYHFGVAICQPNESFRDCIRKVEIALSKAKELDEGHIYLYDDVISELTENRVKLYHSLEKAISAQRIFLNYQPIYFAKTGKLYGFECLARWIDADKGYIPPNEFIAIAERSNLIHSLGQHITEESIAFCLEAKNIGFEGKVTINVSGKELMRDDFGTNLVQIISDAQLEAKFIAVEVTETGLIGNLALAIKHLETLKASGISIYLDDFGTGYSSLSYIDQLPIDVIKIDKSFIDQLLENNKKRQMLSLIIKLAQELSIQTVAEGVETDEQYNLLHTMGVDYIQGYYFSKPLAKEDALKLL